MTRRFRIGQLVRIVRSPYPNKVGSIRTVIGFGGASDEWVPFGVAKYTPVTILGDASNRCGYIGYPDSYLAPYHEPGDFQSLAELLRSLKGVPAKEKA